MLNNCEHVLDSCAALVVALLHVCPEVRFLTTSRVVLGVSSETTRPVPALSLRGPVDDCGPEAVGQSEAVRRVVNRARRNDSLARAELGFAPRPLLETIADTVRWLHRQGHISARQAGRLAAGA